MPFLCFMIMKSAVHLYNYCIKLLCIDVIASYYLVVIQIWNKDRCSVYACLPHVLIQLIVFKLKTKSPFIGNGNGNGCALHIYIWFIFKQVTRCITLWNTPKLSNFLDRPNFLIAISQTFYIVELFSKFISWRISIKNEWFSRESLSLLTLTTSQR